MQRKTHYTNLWLINLGHARGVLVRASLSIWTDTSVSLEIARIPLSTVHPIHHYTYANNANLIQSPSQSERHTKIHKYQRNKSGPVNHVKRPGRSLGQALLRLSQPVPRVFASPSPTHPQRVAAVLPPRFPFQRHRKLSRSYASWYAPFRMRVACAHNRRI